ncbi:peptide ligase PGM1-related protein [Chamaesiphon sp. VAR_69_metabat_338]|uniref:peptide ligase PGM1-related protein n=1 Tax=Chamaesiphon sp. VAR_69_metabat_338 TaxID=2964704 RepID=UPI00286DC6B1|nr:peptide ligase PGM1-related protein [Chamaesiphon sp. VAR_69_metabat_338]
MQRDESKSKHDPFQKLQSRLSGLWQSVDAQIDSDCDILVVPSLSLDRNELLKIEGCIHYEERLLFSLMRLSNPRTRLIYVTSVPLVPMAIDYYLQLLPGIPFAHARERLLLISTNDYSLQPLSQKILDRPRLLNRIEQALRPNRSVMICYNSTAIERDLALKLDVPLYALDPDLLYWGTKAGSRQIFAECGLPHPDGSELVFNDRELAQVAANLWERQPQLLRLVVKLNEGFSGEGNAILDLRTLGNPSSYGDRVQTIERAFEHLSFQGANETWSNFRAKIPHLGAIVEAFVEGDGKQSPSVQGCITPLGTVEILSTHDQILGGPDGQIFLGCQFPAAAGYRHQLQELGLAVGKNLAAKGAIERFGVDFMAVPNADGSWDLEAIEINLRKGGTTHPFMTLKFLTNGCYQLEDGLFYSQQGKPKYYVASDNLHQPHYRGLLPNDLMDIIAHHRLHFDTSTETGTVFHMMGSLSEFGKVGLTSIGNSLAEAREIYAKVEQVLELETREIESQPTLPIAWNYR